MDLNRKKFTLEWAGRELSFETSILAEQAASSVLAKWGDTVVLVTVVMGDKDRSIDYFPLTVDYEEKFYAAGKIIGSRFVRREMRASEEAILSGRLIDRSLRPLFDHRIRRDVQIIVTILAIDEESDPDVLALNAASLALATSQIPWGGPVGGVRVARIGDTIIVNPTNTQLKNVDLRFETFVAGPLNKIGMIELSGQEATEGDVLEGFKEATREIDAMIQFQSRIIKEIGKKKVDVARKEPSEELVKKVKNFIASRLEGVIYTKNKMDREAAFSELKEALHVHIKEDIEIKDGEMAEVILDKEIDELLHKKVLEESKRPDGRALDEIRPLHAETGLFKRTHGSALFVRGNTQALAVTTIAPPGAEQLIETMEVTGKRRFMLHYNFPPYSVGEVGALRGPGRREIGHGALAEKALRPLIPSSDVFPYTVRVVSEILSSNGSSSMASVCAGTLSLMDAGVPIKRPAAGIAMGIVVGSKGEYKVLTDIQGPEDHHGDMDFKVAGTKEGVTAIQMDVKMDGLNVEMLSHALEDAKKARLRILDVMTETLPAPRAHISPFAPTIFALDIDPLKIGEVIGPGGRVINQIIKDTGVTSIDIEQTGKVFVSASDKGAAEKAVGIIRVIVREFNIGEIVEGTISKILEFGAILDLGGGKDGMIHISEASKEYVKDINKVFKIGDTVRAKIIRLEPNGRIGLSVKAID